MINILKEGICLEQAKIIYKRECNFCHSIFEFEDEDLKSKFRSFGNQIGIINCPLCSAELLILSTDIDRRESNLK